MQNNITNFQPPRPIALDLFAGVGGLSLGFEQAGFDVVCSVEFDPIHAAVHQYNFPQTKILCADVSDEEKVNATTLRDAVLDGIRTHGRNAADWDGEIDAIFGGPPCQGFSLAGKRDLSDKRNSLVFHFARVIEELRPRYFVMENVPGMMAGAHGTILEQLVTRLQAAGYVINDPETLNASSFGVPQDRKRVIVIGSRNDVTQAKHPTRSFYPVRKNGAVGTQPKDDAQPLRQGPTVWDALSDLPRLRESERLYKNDEMLLTTEQLKRADRNASAYAATLRGAASDPDDYSHPRKWNRRLIANTALTEHAAHIVKRFKLTGRGVTEPVSRFYRLHPKGLSSTLRAGTSHEYGSYTSPRPIHPYRARVITVREAARLQSFPDWFRFNRTRWHGFREVGNSVPPLLGRAIGASIMTALGLTPIKPQTKVPLGDERLLDMNMSEASKFFGASRPKQDLAKTKATPLARKKPAGDDEPASKAA